jgi:maleate isomerase
VNDSSQLGDLPAKANPGHRETPAPVGILVPPANTTVEPEVWAMAPPGITVHTSRLPGRAQEDTSIGLKERFLGYNRALRETADSFGGAPLSAVALACTGSSYLVSPDGEQGLLADLAAGGARAVNTAARSISEVLRALRRGRLGIVSPYPAWLTEMAVEYWRASGFDVAGAVQVSDVVSIYAIQTKDVVAAALRAAAMQPDVVLLSGTGMASLGAIEQLAPNLEIPMISSNVCTAWWLFEAARPGAWRESPWRGFRTLERWLDSDSGAAR